MMAIARKGMDGSEATFSVEAPIQDQNYLWSDKYRPRKPTYLNRVMTGFDWNKYNQTHYDMDNPPPKIVQGYKFNIFYPDLLDMRKTPSYQVFECDDPDFAEVRFQSGPPYEDIAFKFVNSYFSNKNTFQNSKPRVGGESQERLQVPVPQWRLSALVLLQKIPLSSMILLPLYPS